MATMEAVRRFHDGDDVEDFDALLGSIAGVKLSPTSLTPLPADVVPVMQASSPNLDSPATLDRSLQRRYELCEDYDEEINENLRKMEALDAGQRPCPGYLSKVQHGEMDMYTRARLVRWMYDFTRRYALADGTLHRAVAYADRYMSTVPLRITDYQLRLLGAVAVFTAAKYEDRYTTKKLNPSVIAPDGAFDKDDVLDLEMKMMAALDYRMGGPTAHTFVDHFTRRSGEKNLAHHLADLALLDHFTRRRSGEKNLAHHLADLTLVDYRSLQFPPSVVAASALFVSECAMNRVCGLLWNEGLQEQMACTGYAAGDLAACIAAMYDMHEAAQVWPGYEHMRTNCWTPYSLPDRLEMIRYIFLAA